MKNYIMVGCDLHEKNLNLRAAKNLEEPIRLSFKNTPHGRNSMIKKLKERAGKAKIVFAYEAGPHGFGLYDYLTEQGLECHVLAPTKIPRSVRQKRAKNDDSDAMNILRVLRAHLLAGNDLPSVWVPDKETRDDREIVRARLDIGDKIVAQKNEIHALLKRTDIKKPKCVGGNWTRRHRAWLNGLIGPGGKLGWGAGKRLESLLRQLRFLEEEAAELDKLVKALSETARYAEPAREMMKEKGVGLLVAMVFLSEMGDLSRFGNRRRVASYVGLAPSSSESGESGERKGHITHQGSHRVRKVLCQAVWARVRYDGKEKKVYERIVARNPKHKKIAVVASMRRLVVRLWRVGRQAQKRAGFREKQTRKAKGRRPARCA